jgi:hypothetical protein
MSSRLSSPKITEPKHRTASKFPKRAGSHKGDRRLCFEENFITIRHACLLAARVSLRCCVPPLFPRPRPGSLWMRIFHSVSRFAYVSHANFNPPRPFALFAYVERRGNLFSSLLIFPGFPFRLLSPTRPSTLFFHKNEALVLLLTVLYASKFRHIIYHNENRVTNSILCSTLSDICTKSWISLKTLHTVLFVLFLCCIMRLTLLEHTRQNFHNATMVSCTISRGKKKNRNQLSTISALLKSSGSQMSTKVEQLWSQLIPCWEHRL